MSKLVCNLSSSASYHLNMCVCVLGRVWDRSGVRVYVHACIHVCLCVCMCVCGGRGGGGIIMYANVYSAWFQWHHVLVFMAECTCLYECIGLCKCVCVR